MLPHVVGRPATRKRWPEGVDRDAFFVKDLEPGRPVWLTRVQIRHGSGPKFYPVFDSPAALAWLGQVAALELHVPQWRIGQPAGPATRSTERYPDRVVFDLDPGPGAALAECVEVAVALRERLGILGQRVVPVTSGYQGVGGNAEGSSLISGEAAYRSLASRPQPARRPGGNRLASRPSRRIDPTQLSSR